MRLRAGTLRYCSGRAQTDAHETRDDKYDDTQVYFSLKCNTTPSTVQRYQLDVY